MAVPDLPWPCPISRGRARGRRRGRARGRARGRRRGRARGRAPPRIPEPGGPTLLFYEPCEHGNDPRREGHDLRFIVGGRGANEDGDLDRGANFGGFATGYRIGTRLIGTRNARRAFRDVEASSFRGSRCFVPEFGVSDLRIAHADEELASDVKYLEAMMRQRASSMGSGHAPPERRRRDDGKLRTDGQ